VGLTGNSLSRSTMTVGDVFLLGLSGEGIGASSADVTGIIQSYNPGEETVIQLLQEDTVKYEVSIGAENGTGQTTKAFMLEDVKSGTYDLLVQKAGHLDYRIENVVVGSSAVDLSARTGKAYQTITLLAGDVNGDGSINESDVSVIRYSTNINKTAAEAANELADVNGDGSVTETDVSVVRYTVHMNQSTKDCIFAY